MEKKEREREEKGYEGKEKRDKERVGKENRKP